MRLHEPGCSRGLFRDAEKPSWGRGSKVHFFRYLFNGQQKAGGGIRCPERDAGSAGRARWKADGDEDVCLSEIPSCFDREMDL